MDTWWHSLTLLLQLFYGIGIVAGLVLGLEVLLTLFGLDHHHHLFESGGQHHDGVGLLSIRTITGFFFGFGWSGAIVLRLGYGPLVAIVMACVVGFAFLVGIAFFMRALVSLSASGTLNYQNAVGQVATVYVTVPPNHGGGGQVEVLIQGRLQTIACRTAGSRPLPPQTKVKVVALVDQGTLEVEPL